MVLHNYVSFKLDYIEKDSVSRMEYKIGDKTNLGGDKTCISSINYDISLIFHQLFLEMIRTNINVKIYGLKM